MPCCPVTSHALHAPAPPRRYDASVRSCEGRLSRDAEELGEPLDGDELLLERLDAGLFTLQCGLVSLAALWATGDAGLRKRLLAALHQRGQTLEMVRCAALPGLCGSHACMSQACVCGGMPATSLRCKT